MSDPLDDELDLLFQQLPAAHVEARNALAERLRKGGSRTDAERIKKIKRPAVSAWAINYLHFHQPGLLQAAQTSAAALRSLHARDGVGPSELSAAVTAQRRAVQAAIDAAVRGGAAAGAAVSSVDQRRLETTLQAWLAGAGDEAPGRMTHELEASGFAAVTAVGITPARTPAAARDEHASAPVAAAEPAQAALPLSAAKRGPDPARVARARDVLRSCEQTADAAGKLSSQLQSGLATEAEALERTRDQVGKAEQALSALRAQVKQQESALLEARSRSRSAQSAFHDAQRALAEAQAELARLSEPA